MGRLTVLAFLLMALVSCKKKTYVEIQAQDYLTGNGSAYAGMEYAVAETWTPFLETKSEIVATGFLDENGYAAFDLKMKNNRKYILGVSEPDNICYGGLQQHYLEHEKNNNIEFAYLSCGNVNIHRENINCEGETDEFRYVYYYNDNPDIYIYIEDLLAAPAQIMNGVIISMLGVTRIMVINLLRSPKGNTQ